MLNYSNNFVDQKEELFLTNYQKNIFRHICEYSVSKSKSQIFIDDIILYLEDFDIDENSALDCINYFADLGYINKNHFFENGKFIYFFFVTSAGFESYSRNDYPEYNDSYNAVYGMIKDYNNQDDLYQLKSNYISEKLNIPVMIVNFILEKLYNQRKILLNQGKDENWQITKLLNNYNEFLNW